MLFSLEYFMDHRDKSDAVGESEAPPLITPYGGELIDLTVLAEEKDELSYYANSLSSITLTPRNVFDLELLATGAFSPLAGFMREEDYRRVVDEMRLADGHVFPVPISLQVPGNNVPDIGDVTLRDQKNNILGVLHMEESFTWDRAEFREKVLGTHDERHPLVTESLSWGDVNIAGTLRVIDLPRYYDFPELRLRPAEVRQRLLEIGNAEVVAFQTRNPLHRVHEEIVRRATLETRSTLLLHPVVGLTKPGDIDQYHRVRSYSVLIEKYFADEPAILALLPLAMRMAGPREALWHAVIRRNFGANHLIVGRDHASPGLDSRGEPFYPPYEAQHLVEKYSDELGVKMVPFKELGFSPDTGLYEEIDDGPKSGTFLSLSGSAVRADLKEGRKPPEWFMRPEIAEILSEAEPPLDRRGFCVWFTGLSGAGKSATAEILTVMLMARGRKVTLLDGDVVRTNLSAGLGFDREGRDANIRRIGWVASEVVRHGGVAVCAAISPYADTRAEVRSLIGGDRFFEMFVDTPLEICEERDTKGMYAKARLGEIKGFTGVDDVYEHPEHPELTLDTVSVTAEANAGRIVALLESAGYLKPSTTEVTDKKR